jgi:hypothetical protein
VPVIIGALTEVGQVCGRSASVGEALAAWERADQRCGT